jgi:hypothetical protein
MLDKFRDLGGVVHVNYDLDGFILMDEFIKPERLDEAIDIFEGHELATIDIDIVNGAMK